MSRTERADRYAGHATRTPVRDDLRTLAVLALALAGVLAAWVGIVAFGHLVLTLAAIEQPGVVASLLVGFGLLGFALYAACVIAQGYFARAARRRRRAT